MVGMAKKKTLARTWNLWAHRMPDALWHIGERRWVELHGLTDPLVPVLVEEWLGDQRAAEVTHYGWQGTDKTDPCMIQIRTGTENPMMFLSMCMPYGLQAEIDAGTGKVVALKITERAE